MQKNHMKIKKGTQDGGDMKVINLNGSNNSQSGGGWGSSKSKSKSFFD